MGAGVGATTRRGADRLDEKADAFFGDDPTAPTAKVRPKAKRSAAGAKAAAGFDDESTRFFGRNDGPPRSGRPPQPPPPSAGDLDTMIDDDLDYDREFDATTAFEPMDDLDREPTPALLAARAEPLGGDTDARRANRKPQRSNRSKASEAARVSKKRATRNRKPKEPSRLWLAAGVGVILLAGIAAAYFLTRTGDDTATDGDVPLAVADEETAVTTTEAAATDGETAAEDPGTATEEPASPAAELPTVVFDEAAIGPIDAGVEYNLAVRDGPEGAQYQLLVDGEPQAEMAPALAPVAFTPGRHLLVINLTSPSGEVSTNPVLVYAVGELPASSWRANLSSVNIEGEGWAEAVRQYDEYVAAGHTELQLMPSDRFPALATGYWNLFVGGFADNEAAVAYCEQYGLSVPDQCFPQLADPNATAGG